MALKRKLWTKGEFKTILSLWETKTTEEIAQDLGRHPSAITAIAAKLRKAGANLPKKRRNGYLDSLVSEFVKESKPSRVR